LCEYCKKETTLAIDASADIIKEIKDMPAIVIKEELPNLVSVEDVLKTYKVYQAVGCQHCENTGYNSRVSISEVIEINDQLKEMINNGDKNFNIAAIKKTEDFITMKQDGIIKVLQGVTTIEEIFRVIES